MSFSSTLFSMRSYTPLPFLVLMIIFAQPTPLSMAIGAVVVVLGEMLRFRGVAYAGSLTRVTGSVGAPELIVAGPFAYVRNPLYVGNITIYTGIGIMSNALWPWLVITAFCWFVFQYMVIVRLEEGFLAREFANYAEYRANVPRFIPRLTPYRTPAQANQRPDTAGAWRSERRSLQAMSVAILIIMTIWLVR
jgi:protein-S-isoprenylcysteine O-methyltransferase Ste14